VTSRGTFQRHQVERRINGGHLISGKAQAVQTGYAEHGKHGHWGEMLKFHANARDALHHVE